MDGNRRKNNIISILTKSTTPIKGADIAKRFDVSRQVIVQDIAILRAQGNDIIATPNGYMILSNISSGIKKTIVSQHQGHDNIEEELNTIVDLGGRILDVIVEHPIYGEIKGHLMISSRRDVEEFIKRLNKNNAEPLSTLTDGVHIHTIEVPNEDVFKKIKDELIIKKYLIE
ncbi:transcription repressor NadR [Clostridium sp. D2Q-11]|uniref:Transcription repressor NadR n=1 Tax=Anaeromonas frigoriresistens TaxID=2683708 RepID=A0A942UYI0_9FIRM|nr:transcription repressor NadR [Anaeromonas frigoriresistens]MBS4539149.1 transcription repressor NadR [Anaeromonas frigoriresistens]